MMSFRVSSDDAASVTRWAKALGVDRSWLLRDALRLHLVRLAGERDIDAWVALPRTEDERTLETIADWGPAEAWSDWADAAG